MWLDLEYRIFLFAWLALTKLVRNHYQKVAGMAGVKAAMKANPVDSALGVLLVLVWEGGLGIYIFYPPWLAWSALDFPPWLRWTGAVVGLPALLLLVWSHRALGRNFSVTLRLRDDHRLVTEGPYRWIRHPIYAAALLQGVAFFLITANWFIGVTWIAGGLLMFGLRMPREEAGLEGRFGEAYRAYKGRTGRLIPRSPG